MSSIVHFEFSVPNPEEAAAFYSAVFGWSITKLADPIRYWQIRTAEAPAQRAIPGGIVQSKTGAPRASVTIQVPSLSDACTRVIARRNAGGDDHLLDDVRELLVRQGRRIRIPGREPAEHHPRPRGPRQQLDEGPGKQHE
jgi:predicted enzyme related to lactoylglutathione lyase